MKKRLILPTALCLAVLLFVCAACADEAPAGRLLRIDDASYEPETGFLSVTWTNTGEKAITGAELRVIPRDGEGNQLVIGGGYLEEILLEERTYHTFAATAPGESATAVFPAGVRYPAAAAFDVAFDAVTAEDGAASDLPDSCLCWYSTREKAYTRIPEGGGSYTPPAEDVLAKAAGFRLGLKVIAVPGELADAYGFAHSGMLVVETEEDSLADLLGLAPGDLIFAVDETQYANEPNVIVLAAAALSDNRPMTLWIERDGGVLSFALAP